MDIQRIKNFWVTEADEALKVAGHLFEKEDYSYALFFGHPSLEKILKAVYVVKKGEHAPYIHNLEKLAVLADIALSDERKNELQRISRFNLEARYPDDKRDLKPYAQKNLQKKKCRKIEEIYQWLKSMIEQ